MAFAVAGATSWGLALASLLARHGEHTFVIARTGEEAAALRDRRAIDRLPGFVIPPSIHPVSPSGLPDEVQGLVVAVPAQSARSFLAALHLPADTPVINGAKGLEQGAGSRISEVLVDLGYTNVAAISGPNLAREIVGGLPAAAVVACPRDDVAAFWQEAFASPTFRTYRTGDIVGVELSGAIKNVVAIAAGAATGMGFGANTVASLMTRGLAEMSRLGAALGASPATFSGLAGVGDLAATCFSPLSRNHRLGELLAAGFDSASAIAEIGEAVEGAVTAAVAVDLGRRNGVEMPIAEQVAAVIAGERTVPDAMSALLSRTRKPE